MADLTPFVEGLLNGSGSVVSYPGTSQYSKGGASACGLAAFNCARIVLGWETHQGRTANQVLQAFSEKEPVLVCASNVPFPITTHFDQEIISICENTGNLGHLEAEEIMALPLFSNALELKNTEYCVPNLNNITNLLRYSV
jgi:hypothetical protein